MLGYIAADLQWEQFNELWTFALREYSVPEFHAVDFFPRQRQRSSTNPYRGWSDDLRIEFLDTLLGIRAHCRLVPIGWAVNISDFQALTYEQRRFFTGGYLETNLHVEGVNTEEQRTRLRRKFKTSGAPSRPYMVAFNQFLYDAWWVATDDALIHVVLDRQGALESGATQYFNRSWLRHDEVASKRFASISYQDSRDIPALQAADMYAYAWGRYLEGSKNDEIRYVMRKLTRLKKHLGLADAPYFKKELERLHKEDLSNEDHLIGLVDGTLETEYYEGGV